MLKKLRSLLNSLVIFALFPTLWRQWLWFPFNPPPTTSSPTASWKSAAHTGEREHQTDDASTSNEVFYTLYQTQKSPRKTPPENKKYIVHVVGNRGSLSSYPHDYNKEAKLYPDAIIAVLSAPDLDFSDGSSCLQNVIDSTITVVNRFVKKEEAQKNNILLVGHSLGGAILAQVAAKMPGVHLIADRTFSKLSKALTYKATYPTLLLSMSLMSVFAAISFGWIAGASVIFTSTLAIEVGRQWLSDKLFLPLFECLLAYTVGDIDTTAAFNAIQPSHKSLLNVAEDEVIPLGASLMASLELGEEQKIDSLFNFPYVGFLSIFNGRIQILTSPKNSELNVTYKNPQPIVMLNGSLVNLDAPFTGAHRAALGNLQNGRNHTGQEWYQSQIKKHLNIVPSPKLR